MLRFGYLFAGHIKSWFSWVWMQTYTRKNVFFKASVLYFFLMIGYGMHFSGYRIFFNIFFLSSCYCNTLLWKNKQFIFHSVWVFALFVIYSNLNNTVYMEYFSCINRKQTYSPKKIDLQLANWVISQKYLNIQKLSDIKYH